MALQNVEKLKIQQTHEKNWFQRFRGKAAAVSTSLIATTNVHAANDLERWNSDVGRTVRQTQSDKLAQTTYREMSSKNVTVSQDMRTVYPQIETQAQVAGSRTRVVAEAVLEVDKNKVWKDWARKIGKFGKGANAVGGALVVGGLIVDAAGWVIDEGGKVTKKPSEELDPNKPYYFYENRRPEKIYYDRNSGASAALAYYEPTRTDIDFTGFKLTSNTGNNQVAAYACYNYQGSNYCDDPLLNVKINEHYDPSAPPPQNIEVSEAEKEQVLKNLLNDPKYADLAAQMIGNTYSMGPDNPEPDPDVVNDLKNKQKDVLKSDNPKGDGKTRTDPKIDTGTQGQADTTPKPDTGTGTNPDPGTTPNPNPNTGSTTNFELPAFCNYAAIVCDWIGWTKEEPELEEDSELEIEEQELIDYEYSDYIKFDASCPFKPRQEIFPLGALGDMRVEVDFSYFCEIATMMKSFVVALSGFIAVLMLAYAAKDI